MFKIKKYHSYFKIIKFFKIGLVMVFDKSYTNEFEILIRKGRPVNKLGLLCQSDRAIKNKTTSPIE